MEKNANAAAEQAAKKNIADMNLEELRKERHHIAAKISGKKKAGKDVTELKEQEKAIVTMIANMVAREKATRDAEKQVARAKDAAKKADEKKAKATQPTKVDPAPECSEKETIINALKASNGNRKEAAKALGFSERTLYRRLNQYGITL